MAVAAASAGGCSATRRHDHDYSDDDVRLPWDKKHSKQGKNKITKTSNKTPGSVTSSPKKADDTKQDSSAKCNVL